MVYELSYIEVYELIILRGVFVKIKCKLWLTKSLKIHHELNTQMLEAWIKQTRDVTISYKPTTGCFYSSCIQTLTIKCYKEEEKIRNSNHELKINKISLPQGQNQVVKTTFSSISNTLKLFLFVFSYRTVRNYVLQPC